MDNENQLLNESQIAELLKKTGTRQLPPSVLADEVYSNVKSVWQEEVDLRRRKFKQRFFAIAAGFMLMIGAGFMAISMPEGSSNGMNQFASVTQAINVVEQRVDDQAWSVAYLASDSSSVGSSGASTAEFQELRTGTDSYAFVAMDTGFEIRLDSNTQVLFRSREEIEVLSGAVYVDSNQLKKGRHLLVNTPFGQTRDIGTQYEVRLLDDTLRVQVREGRVDVTTEAGLWAAKAGERIVLADNKVISKSELKPDDESWQWTQNVGKKFQIDGQTLDAYLHWLERESGKRTVYQSDEAETAAKATILHGTIDGLGVLDSLPAVLATTNFHIVPSTGDSSQEASAQEGAIVVGN